LVEKPLILKNDKKEILRFAQNDYRWVKDRDSSSATE
jgi:hypothetical protein